MRRFQRRMLPLPFATEMPPLVVADSLEHRLDSKSVTIAPTPL
jgi:hypothetical protein